MLYFYKGRIIQSDSKEEAVKVFSASSYNGVRLYLLLQESELYLISFYCGDSKRLKSLRFEEDDYYYVKPVSSVVNFTMECDSNILKKMASFKNGSGLSELKKYVATSKADSTYWFAIFEGQGMLVSLENEPGFYKIPKIPLYREASSLAKVKLIVKTIQNAGLKIDNLHELSNVCKKVFGQPLDLRKKIDEVDEFDIEYTTEFLEDQFDLFNDRYFLNKLPKIPLKWRSTKRYGACYWNYRDGKINVPYISISRHINNYKEFRDTLVHEMCHAFVDLSITPSKLESINNKYSPMSTMWKKELGLTDDTCHSGDWKRLIEHLNNKFPELRLKRMGSSNYEDRDEKGNFTKEAIDRISSGHLLIRNTDGKKKLKFVNEEVYQKILKCIKDGITAFPWGGIWTELSFIPEKVAEVLNKPDDSITNYYRSRILKQLKEMNAITGSRVLN